MLTEDLLTLAQAARLIPGARGAHRIAPSTVYRWCLKGVRTASGIVRLESIRVGSRLLTTRQAIDRFVAALSSPVPSTSSPTRTPTARQRASAAASAALEAAGA